MPESTTFHFGDLSFVVRGKGVFCPSEGFAKRFEGLGQAQLRKINKEAWALSKKSELIMSRSNNVSVCGNAAYDGASFTYYVADAVRKASWKQMQVTHYA